VIVRWLRANAVVVWLAVLALAVAGAISVARLPSGIYPEMTFPRVVVVAHAGQLAPELVEAQVTRPLEEALAVVPGVRHVRAKTIRVSSAICLPIRTPPSAPYFRRTGRTSLRRSLGSRDRTIRLIGTRIQRGSV